MAENSPKVITDATERAQRYRPGDPARRVNPDLEKRPPWLRVSIPIHGSVREMENLVTRKALNTVCQSASCPNRGECWARGTATIMILGNICTRSCGFCAVKTGRPTELDLEEPTRVAEAVKLMGLGYVVITSVDRDELDDGGSGVWAATIEAIRQACPDTGIEVLIPDFRGELKDQQRVFDARPHVLAHNMETIERLHPTVRPQAQYQRSLDVIRRTKEAGLVAKSGLMLGLGEEIDEVLQTLRDLRDANCDVLTLGQYLQPTRQHLPVERWVHPDEFEMLREKALAMGFGKCDSGPLVRSSYRAESVMDPDLPLADVIAHAIGRKDTGPDPFVP